MNEPISSRYRIRPAREGDLPALSDLLDELFAIETDFAPDRARQRRGLSALLNAGERACVLVAEERGKAIGMATCQVLISTAEGGEVGLVEDVVVGAARRGQGVGQALVRELELWAKGRRLLRLQLLADGGNTAALRFYRRLGWCPTQLVALRRKAGEGEG
jgi:GNAT superfamily N-acetyltransferase